MDPPLIILIKIVVLFPRNLVGDVQLYKSIWYKTEFSASVITCQKTIDRLRK